MRIAQATLFLAFAGSTLAFTSPFCVNKAFRPIFMSEDALEEAAPTLSTPASGLTHKDVRKAIDGLTKENFSKSLSLIEPFLLNEAGATIYAKSLRRIADRAKSFEIAVPAGYAKEAKATQKRREKQDAFIKVKEENAAAAKAAEAAAAAEAAEAAAAVPTEETPSTEPVTAGA
jgi:pyruvate/2-oxoglutarate dehydrogenase complex dihydrolipoamide acyltransferase (E2) component